MFSMELFNFLEILGRRKWLITTIVIISLVVSIISVSIAEIPKQARNVLHFNFAIPTEVSRQTQFPYRIPAEQNAFDFVALFSTDGVIREGITRSGIDIDPYEAKESIHASVQMVKIGGDDERTSFIEVLCELPNGKQAVALVNGVTEAATEKFQQILTKSVTDHRSFLEIQAVGYEQDIRNLEGQIREFHLQNPGFIQVADNEAIATRKAQLQFSIMSLSADLAGMDKRIQLTSSDLSRYRKGDVEIMAPALAGNATVDNLRNKILDLEFQKSQYSGRFSEQHPMIRKFDAELSTARDEYRVEIVKFLEEQLIIFKAQRAEMSSELAAYEEDKSNFINEATGLAEAQIEYSRLTTELALARELHDTLKTSLAEAVNEESKATSRYTVEVVEQATEAERRREIWYQPSFRVALALLGGVFFSLILAFFLEYVTIKSSNNNSATA